MWEPLIYSLSIRETGNILDLQMEFILLFFQKYYELCCPNYCFEVFWLQIEIYRNSPFIYLWGYNVISEDTIGFKLFFFLEMFGRIIPFLPLSSVHWSIPGVTWCEVTFYNEMCQHSFELIFSKWPTHDVTKSCLGRRSIQSTIQTN